MKTPAGAVLYQRAEVPQRTAHRAGCTDTVHGVRDLDPAFRFSSQYLAAGRVDSLPRRSVPRATSAIRFEATDKTALAKSRASSKR